MSSLPIDWGVPIPPAERAALAPLFTGTSHTYILDSVLDGLAGEAHAAGDPAPAVGYAAFADIFYIGGDTQHPEAATLIANLPLFKGLFFAPDSPWPALAKAAWGERLVEIERYTFPKATFDPERLHALAARLPESYHIAPIDTALARHIMDAEGDPILEDHIRQFGSAEAFSALGFGFCACAGDRIAALISTYAVARAGVEIQITTYPDDRRKGLATALGATFILDCLERGLDPHWDAANENSCRLAEKLGYAGCTPYPMWVLTDDKA